MEITRKIFDRYVSCSGEEEAQALAEELGFEIWFDLFDAIMDAAEKNGWPIPKEWL